MSDADMMSVTPRGPGRPRNPATDAAILQAALDLFIQAGVDGVTIEQVAARAGVSRTTVYRRWSSREALLTQAIGAARGFAEGRAFVAAPDISDLPDVAERLVAALAETVTAPDYARLLARLIGSVPGSPDFMLAYWNTYLEPRRVWIGQLLRQAQREGLVRADADIEMLLDLIGGAVMYHILIRPGKRTAEETRAYLTVALRELGLVI